MKKIIVYITFALALIVAAPVYGQKTAAQWQEKVKTLEQQLKETENRISTAEAEAKAAKNEDDLKKAQAARQSAISDNNSTAAQLRNARAELAKAQQAEGGAAQDQATQPAGEPVQNEDPTPPVVADSVDADSTAAEGEVVDATHEEANAEDSGGLPSGWWKYLLTMLGISALCSAGVFVVLNNKIAEMKNIIKGETQGSLGNINQRLDNLAAKTDRIENTVGSVRQDLKNRPANYGSVPPAAQPVSHHAPSAQPAQPQRPTQFYLGIPSPDGTWRDVKTTGDSGQSLYQLNSADGVNGTFSVINKPGAVQSILMAVGKYLNPVCRVTNTATQVSGIITDEPGTAVCENGVWRMTKKAIVHYV